MELIIDNREKIIDLFEKKDYVKCENLTVGDYHIKLDGNTIVIIERKTINDLANSIVDGRYREQKKRLLDNFPKHQIIYILEGDIETDNLSNKYNRITIDTIYSSIINLYHRDNINLFKSKNSRETVKFIETIMFKISKDNGKFLKKNVLDNALFNNLKKGGCKKNIDSNLVYKLQLSCIPNISNKIAEIIIEKYSTMTELINNFSGKTEDDRIKIISDIKYELKNGKKRKLGKRVGENLNKYLFQ